ncbi:hypothetical protein [Dactylosporangium sp. NPDC051541]|uniref:hypothetical protein n=1 Tax=Dactylosporangium sp. NPDC051541 TaxID=3363977 RepID=UPI0037A33B8A
MNGNHLQTDALTRHLARLDDTQLVAWARLAVLRWFDDRLLEFVIDDDLSAPDVFASPIVERVNTDSSEGLFILRDYAGIESHRYRVRDSLRERLLAAQRGDAGRHLTYAAGLAAAYFRVEADESLPDALLAIEEIRYLSIADPDGARVRLAGVARSSFTASESGAASSAAVAAMWWTGLQAHLDPRLASARDRLARLADVICATAAVMTAVRDDDLTLWRVRLLQLALDRATRLGVSDERWLLDTAESVVEAVLTDHLRRSGQDSSSVLHGADSWSMALAFVTNSHAVFKQSHDITFVSERLVRYRGTTVLQLREVAAHTVRPVPLALLPRSVAGLAHTLEAHDQRGVEIPTLNVTQANRLLATVTLMEHAVPEPGVLAANPSRIDDIWTELHRLQTLIEARVGDPDLVSEDLGASYSWIDSIVAELQESVAVVGLLDAGVAASQVVRFEVHVPVPSPASSRVSGRVVAMASIGRLAQAVQQIHVTVPRGLVPLGPATPHLTPLGEGPGAAGRVSQTFEFDAAHTQSTIVDVGFHYGIGPAERLKTIVAATPALLISGAILWLSPVSADALGYQGLALLTALTALGTVSDVALRFQRRSPGQEAGRVSLRRRMRLTGMLALAAWAVLVIGVITAVVTGRTSTETTPELVFSMAFAVAAVVVETYQLFADVRATQRQTEPRSHQLPLRYRVESGHSFVSIRDRQRPTDQQRLLESADVQTRRQWDQLSVELLRPQPVELRWTRRRPPGVLPLDAPAMWAADGDAQQLVDTFLSSTHRKVLIIGRPGSGKTAMAILLGEGLLRRRNSNSNSTSPVPVKLRVATWQPLDEPFPRWVARSVARSPRERAEIAELVEAGRVTVVLDGLDELTEQGRLAAIHGMEHADRRVSVILTCRTDEYNAVLATAPNFLSSAAVIELEPLALDGSIAPAEVQDLSRTPEALELNTLARADRTDRPDSIAGALTHAALVRAYSWQTGNDLQPSLGVARRWLESLATLSARTGGGIDWFELYRMVPRIGRGVAAAVVSATVIASATAIGVAVIGHPVNRQGLLSGFALNLLGLCVVVLARSTPRRLERARQVWTDGVVSMTAVAATFTAADVPVARSAWVVAATAAGYGLAGAVTPIVRRRLAARRARQALTGRSSLRLAFAMALLEAWPPVLLAGCLLAVAVLPIRAIDATAAVLVTALAGTLPMLLGFWGWYHLSRIMLAARGGLPWRLVHFLDDAADRRLLRRRGFGWDFRHVAFQSALTVQPGPNLERRRVIVGFAALQGAFTGVVRSMLTWLIDRLDR